MTGKTFETENLPGAAYGFQMAALHLIEELVKNQPNRAYIQEIRRLTVESLKNAVPVGIPMEEEHSYVEASVGAANFIFDHIAWR